MGGAAAETTPASSAARSAQRAKGRIGFDPNLPALAAQRDLQLHLLARVELRDARLRDAARAQPGRKRADPPFHAEFASELRQDAEGLGASSTGWRRRPRRPPRPARRARAARGGPPAPRCAPSCTCESTRGIA